MAIISLIFILAVKAATGKMDCCSSKTVGGVSYSLAPESKGLPFPDKCNKECAYMKNEEKNDGLYCFGPGHLESKCTGENPYPVNVTGSKHALKMKLYETALRNITQAK